MLTYSGVDMLPGGKNAPAPIDLAVHMGRICQFGGAVWFTLLAHSVFVAELVLREVPKGDGWTWAWALFHDAHEVVTSDVPRGWKGSEMKAVQTHLDRRISERYGFDHHLVDRELVGRMDKRAICVQADRLNLGQGAYFEAYPHTEPTPEEDTLFQKIKKGPLNDPTLCLNAVGWMIGCMDAAFRRIEAGKPEEALNIVHAVADANVTKAVGLVAKA